MRITNSIDVHVYITAQSIDQDCDDILQGIKRAFLSTVESMDPNQDLDGIRLALENILQGVLILQPFLQS